MKIQCWVRHISRERREEGKKDETDELNSALGLSR